MVRAAIIKTDGGDIAGRIFLPEDAPASDSREALRAERDKLLARLAEINAKLGN